jgi:hypothetical protein
VLEPADDLRLRTSSGLRRVQRITMRTLLRWKHERIPVSSANVVQYRAAAPGDPMPPQIRAEFESKEATASNLRLGIQFRPGDERAQFTLQLTPGKKA